MTPLKSLLRVSNMLKLQLTPGLIRGGLSLIGYALGALFYLILGRYAPVNVINPVAYLIGVFNFIILFTSPSSSSYTTCSLIPLYLSLSLITIVALILHPPYFPITLTAYGLYIYLAMLFIRRIEVPRYSARRELSWSIAVAPYTVGARIIQLALGALGLINPLFWVLSLTLPLPIGQYLNNAAYRGGVKMCGNGDYLSGLSFTILYHAPYIPLNIVYFIMPNESAGVMINTIISYMLTTSIQADKLWGRGISKLRFISLPASVLIMLLLEEFKVINPIYITAIPIALIASTAAMVIAWLTPLHLNNSFKVQ